MEREGGEDGEKGRERRKGKGAKGGKGRVAPLSEILNTPLCPPHCFRPGDAPGFLTKRTAVSTILFDVNKK